MKTILALFFSLLYCQNLVAQDLNYAETEQYPVPYYSEQHGTLQQSIRFPVYHISKTLRDKLQGRINDLTSPHRRLTPQAQHNIPKKIALDMHDIDVLNQGVNGVCTFFSTVTAIRASLNPRIGLSPMCLVQLDKYLHPNPKGSITIKNPLNLIQTYGIVPLHTQEELGCAGIYVFNPGHEISMPMSPEEYQHKSEPYYKKHVSWRYVFDDFSGFINPIGRLLRVKEALSAGRYVVLEFLVSPEDGVGGAVGTHKIKNDTWIFNDTIVDNIVERMYSERVVLGHAIVITGYDDAAVAVDAYGNAHRGLLKLRNSWGALSGDNGDFYMSYDYLTSLGVSAVQVCTNQQGNNLACW